MAHSRETRLRAYVLGELDPSARQAVVQDLEESRHCRQLLDLVVDDLIELYAMGELEEAAARGLREGVLASPDGQARLAMTLFLHRRARRKRGA